MVQRTVHESCLGGQQQSTNPVGLGQEEEEEEEEGEKEKEKGNKTGASLGITVNVFRETTTSHSKPGPPRKRDVYPKPRILAFRPMKSRRPCSLVQMGFGRRHQGAVMLSKLRSARASTGYKKEVTEINGAGRVSSATARPCNAITGDEMALAAGAAARCS